MNLIALKTLVYKEVKRSLLVPTQTFGAPVLTALLFFLVFGTAIGSRIGDIDGLTYTEFIMPGLIMMNVLTNAFMSVSSAFMISKITNTMSDIFLAPMSYLEIILGFTISAVVRGVITAGLIYGTALFFVPVHIEHPFFLLFFLILVAFSFGFLGLIIGIWADNFEQVSVFPTFLLTPLTFLGGVFYSIQDLPEKLRLISTYNPFLYMINGMRYGFYGVTDVSASLILFVTGGLTLFLVLVAWNMFRTGYKIKS